MKSYRKGMPFLCAAALLSQLAVCPVFAADETVDIEEWFENTTVDEGALTNSSLGFFQWMNDQEAILTLIDSQSSSMPAAFKDTTHIGEEGDATSLSNLEKAVQMIAEGNELRSQDKDAQGNPRNLPGFKVSGKALAQAQVEANAFAATDQLADLYSETEIAMEGFPNPWTFWYDDGRAEYLKNEEGNARTCYDYLMNPQYKVMGLGWNGPAKKSGTAVGVLYSTDGSPVYTPEEYLAKIQQYKDEMAAQTDPSQSDAVAMYRLYNPNSGEHFYTGNRVEKDMLVEAGWVYEQVEWFAPVQSDTPVYRLYNPNAGDHHYTTSAGERDVLVDLGWNYEQIGWYSAPDTGVPLYRLYNPNATTGTHNYTTSEGEAQMLEDIGWNYEGIGWYGVDLTA